jgi:flavin reductase (DIM6/NTAB) family NADH-FMN oxidoreductase RutF
MLITPKDLSPQDFYKILIGSVLPRPIAWVSTINKDGKANLAPFSFFTVASAKPPVLCFAPSIKANGQEKDTLKNVKATKEFVVNVVSHALVEQMNLTSGEYDSSINEFDVANLTAVASTFVKPPRVKESLVNMECRLYQLIEIGTEPMGGSLVLGEIVAIHLDEGVYHNGRVDADVLQPVGRMAGNWYSTVKDRFELARPSLPSATKPPNK